VTYNCKVRLEYYTKFSSIMTYNCKAQFECNTELVYFMTELV